MRQSIEESETDLRLRGNIRLLGDLLGHTLVRQEGQGLLDLVEQVRALIREDPLAATQKLRELDLEAAILLARSFSIYFDLANIAEQVERTNDVLDAYVSAGSPLAKVVKEALAAKPRSLYSQADVTALASNMSVRPVFTAHTDGSSPAFSTHQVAKNRGHIDGSKSLECDTHQTLGGIDRSPMANR